MSSSMPTRISQGLPAEQRGRLMEYAREVNFPEGTRLFHEGGRADRFWIVRSGVVTLDMHVPGKRPAVIENLGPGELVGWSWMFRPHRWHLGAEATTPLRTHEFDAEAVRGLMDSDPEFKAAIAMWVGQVLAHRLQVARERLLDLYGPYGSGSGQRG